MKTKGMKKVDKQPEGVRSVESTLAAQPATREPRVLVTTKGVTVKYEDGCIVVRIPYDKKRKDYPENESGKSRMIGTTGGWMKDPIGSGNEQLSVTAAAILVIPKAERK